MPLNSGPTNAPLQSQPQCQTQSQPQVQSQSHSDQTHHLDLAIYYPLALWSTLSFALSSSLASPQSNTHHLLPSDRLSLAAGAVSNALAGAAGLENAWVDCTLQSDEVGGSAAGGMGDGLKSQTPLCKTREAQDFLADVLAKLLEDEFGVALDDGGGDASSSREIEIVARRILVERARVRLYYQSKSGSVNISGDGKKCDLSGLENMRREWERRGGEARLDGSARPLVDDDDDEDDNEDSDEEDDDDEGDEMDLGEEEQEGGRERGKDKNVSQMDEEGFTIVQGRKNRR